MKRAFHFFLFLEPTPPLFVRIVMDDFYLSIEPSARGLEDLQPLLGTWSKVWTTSNGVVSAESACFVTSLTRWPHLVEALTPNAVLRNVAEAFVRVADVGAAGAFGDTVVARVSADFCGMLSLARIALDLTPSFITRWRSIFGVD